MKRYTMHNNTLQPADNHMTPCRTPSSLVSLDKHQFTHTLMQVTYPMNLTSELRTELIYYHGDK